MTFQRLTQTLIRKIKITTFKFRHACGNRDLPAALDPPAQREENESIPQPEEENYETEVTVVQEDDDDYFEVESEGKQFIVLNSFKSLV